MLLRCKPGMHKHVEVDWLYVDDYTKILACSDSKCTCLLYYEQLSKDEGTLRTESKIEVKSEKQAAVLLGIRCNEIAAVGSK